MRRLIECEIVQKESNGLFDLCLGFISCYASLVSQFVHLMDEIICTQ